MLCVLILNISGVTYSLKSTPNDRFFEKLFMAILFTLRVFARNLLSGNRRRNTFRISFWCLAWDSNPGFSSNKPTHYLLDHGDFKVSHQYWNSTTLIHSYSVQHWFISTGCKEHEHNVDIKLIIFEICLIHTTTHSEL